MFLRGVRILSVRKTKSLFYLVIILISLLPAIVLLNKGFVTSGHDNAFHFAQIQDLYDSWKAGQFNYYLNYEANHFMGMGVRLMYAPFSHIITVIIGFMIIPFGFTLTSAMKLVIYLSIVLSGIFMYHLAKKVTKHNFISLIVAIIYMLFPYRYSVIYIRNAYAETVAMTFIPLVFNGIYSLITMEKFSIKPFLLTIIGVTLLFMTHNITAIYCFVFIAVMVLFHLPQLIRRLKNGWFWCGSIISLLLIVCLISPLLFPLLEHRNLGIYRIFDATAMNTNLDFIIKESDRSFAFFYAGVSQYWLDHILYFLLLNIPFLMALLMYQKYDKGKEKIYFYFLIFAGLIFSSIVVYYIVRSLSYILFLALFLETLILSFQFIKIERKTGGLLSFLSFATLLAISFILCVFKFPWKIMPNFLYTIQFPWRLWTFVGFFLSLCVGFLLKYLNSKAILTLSGGLIVGCSILVIRPIYLNSYDTTPDTTIDIEDTYIVHSAGWQLEYFPIEFLKGPKSSFFWQAHGLMYEKTAEKLEKIGIIEGNGSYRNYKYLNGVITFDLAPDKECLIEVPRIYYLGYEITIKDGNGKITKLEPICSEGFVGFRTELSGSVKVEYVGTAITNSAKYLFLLGVLTTAGLSIFLTLKQNKAKNTSHYE